MQFERAKIRYDFMHGNMPDRLFSLHSVVNQVGDSSDFQTVFLSKGLQLRPTCHAAVFVQNLYQDGCRFQPGQHGHIDTRLGVAGTSQYTTRLRHQRKNMSGLRQVFRTCIGPHSGADRMGTVIS